MGFTCFISYFAVCNDSAGVDLEKPAAFPFGPADLYYCLLFKKLLGKVLHGLCRDLAVIHFLLLI